MNLNRRDIASNQCLGARDHDASRDALFVGKANLELCGMHVDVNLRVRDVEIEYRKRKTPDEHTRVK